MHSVYLNNHIQVWKNKIVSWINFEIKDILSVPRLAGYK